MRIAQKMTETFAALLEKDAHSLWGVWFPDLPGCITAAATAQDAQSRAAEALLLYIADMVCAGEPMPTPSPWNALSEENEVRAGLATGATILHVPFSVERLQPYIASALAAQSSSAR